MLSKSGFSHLRGALATLLFMWTASSEASLRDDFESVVKLHGCIENVEPFVREWHLINSNWLGDSSTDTNILANMERLLGTYADEVSLIEGLVARYKDQGTSQNLEEVRRAMANLDGDYERANGNIAQTLVREEKFIRSVGLLELSLDHISTGVQGVRPLCLSEARALTVVDRLAQNAAQWRKALGQVRAFVALRRSKRDLAARVTLKTLKLSLMQNYAQAAGKELNTLDDSLAAVLESDDLYARMRAWWYQSSQAKGMARGELNNYLNYSEARRYLQADLLQIEIFSNALENLNVAEEIRSRIGGELGEYRKELMTSLEKMEAGGRAALLLRQKFLSQKRAVAASASPRCRKAAENMLSFAASAVGAEDFEKAALIYRYEVDVCQGGTP
jgi:hypothetical protein